MKTKSELVEAGWSWSVQRTWEGQAADTGTLSAKWQGTNLLSKAAGMQSLQVPFSKSI